MGIIIDIIFLAIIISCAYWGYKRGLVELGVNLLAGIMAVVVMLISFKPITNLVIQTTQIDESIQKVIVENVNKKIDEKSSISTNKYIQNTADNMAGQFKGSKVIKYAKTITENIISIIVSLMIFVLTKVVLMFIKALADFVAKLPILRQFNKIGGAGYGAIKGAIIVCICVFALGMISKFTVSSGFDEFIGGSVVTRTLLNVSIENI